MPSGHTDSNPNKGERKGGGKKNVDGREAGSGWNSDKRRSSFSDKKVGDMPNEGNKEGLGRKGVIGKVVE